MHAELHRQLDCKAQRSALQWGIPSKACQLLYVPRRYDGLDAHSLKSHFCIDTYLPVFYYAQLWNAIVLPIIEHDQNPLT